MADTIGARVKQLREQLGVSQAELVAGSPLSPSYVSLIETGKRQPRDRVLETLAERLGCSVDYLVTGRGGPRSDEVEMRLRFAEMVLRQGEPDAALAQFADACASARQLRYADLALEAAWGVARAHEARGDLPAAITEFQTLADTAELPSTVSRGSVLVRLCRAHGFGGDLNRAIEVGESALRLIESRTVGAATDEAVELACTLAGCYYERGDLMQAQILAERALLRAEATGSSRARAAAYWETSMVASARGDLRAALRLAERALTLYSEIDVVRSVGNLSVICAWLMLRLPNPDVGTAQLHLARAVELLTAQGGPIELSWAQTEMARCFVLRGDPNSALDLLASALSGLGDAQPLEQARAHAVRGEAYLAMGQTSLAGTAYAEAATRLSAARQNREVAAVWRDLAEAFVALRDYDRSSDAFRRLADAAGVADRSRPVGRTTGPGPSLSSVAGAAVEARRGNAAG